MGGIGDFFGGIVDNVTKGIGEVFTRPGDIINNPGKFFGEAAMGAAPFLAGPLAGALGTAAIPGWAGSLMSAGGGMLSGNQQRMPGGGTGAYYNSMMGGGLNPALLGAGIYGMTQKLGDNGMGQKALDYADLIGQAGKGQLTQAQTGLPSLSQLGELSKIPGITAQEAQLAGVTDPFTGQNYGTNDPYAIQPYQQQIFNQTADMVNQGRQASLSNARQQMAAAGINDPRALAAAEAQINAGHDQMLQQTHTNLATQAYQNRASTLNAFQNLLPTLYGAQTGAQQQAYQNAYRMLTEPVSAYENAAQRQIGINEWNMANQAGALGNLLGYGQGAPRLPGQGGGVPGQTGQTGLPGMGTGGDATAPIQQWIDQNTGMTVGISADGQYFVLDPSTGQPMYIDPNMMNLQSPFAQGYPVYDPYTGAPIDLGVDQSTFDPSSFWGADETFWNAPNYDAPLNYGPGGWNDANSPLFGLANIF